MHITYFSKEKTEKVSLHKIISDIPNFSLPQIYQVNRDLVLLSYNDDSNVDLYIALFGFSKGERSIWIKLPKISEESRLEYFALGISFKYLILDVPNLDNYTEFELKEIIEGHLNTNENLINILSEEFDLFSSNLREFGISDRLVFSFVVRAAYYVNLFLVKKLRLDGLVATESDLIPAFNGKDIDG